jgi:hypothetical protein
MDTHPKAGNMDAGREVFREVAMDTAISDEEAKQTGVFVDEKNTAYNDISDSSDDGHIPHVYELDNMVRDEEGRIVVETSELAVTVLHVDDDPTLSPWTFRTFFLGMCIGYHAN